MLRVSCIGEIFCHSIFPEEEEVCVSPGRKLEIGWKSIGLLALRRAGLPQKHSPIESKIFFVKILHLMEFYELYPSPVSGFPGGFSPCTVSFSSKAHSHSAQCQSNCPATPTSLTDSTLRRSESDLRVRDLCMSCAPPDDSVYKRVPTHRVNMA